MSNGFLSQDEIDSLLGGGNSKGGSAKEGKSTNEDGLSDIEKDLLGEVGNISMGSASTALYQIINQKVNITTPVVTITTLDEMKEHFEIPNIVLEVEYTTGIIGRNILVIRRDDAAVIANLMMGGDGKPDSHELTELEISAVQEAMNQMIGSAATSMATMFSRKVDISPPISKMWTDKSDKLSEVIPGDQSIVRVNFHLTIGDLVDSNIMQVLPIETAKKISAIMMGTEETHEAPQNNTRAAAQAPVQQQPQAVQSKPIVERPAAPVEVHQASFEPLVHNGGGGSHQNIDLILDVPLDISVVLGRTRKSIKEILSLGTGSLVELDKLAEEPVEILVNGKQIAYGEVVVVDENFGVRITSIVSSSERIRSLK